MICKKTIIDYQNRPTVVLRQKGSDGNNEASRLRGDNVCASHGDTIHSGCRRRALILKSSVKSQKLNQIVVLLATSVRRHRRSNFEIIVYSAISLRNIPAKRGAMTFSM